MRKSAFLVGLVLSVIIISTVNQASAMDISYSQSNIDSNSVVTNLVAMNTESNQTDASNSNDESEKKRSAVKYTVKKGDTLIKIAKKYQTKWPRLFDKNLAIEDPDVINIDDELVIPHEDEKLEKRELPKEISEELVVAATEPPVSSSNTSSPNAATPSPAHTQSRSRGNTTGNLYTYGYCTWYVKNRRPDLPNNLGNANTWAARAAAQGIATGSTPRVGAVGQQGMHVVYVEKVHGNGQVTISEMNYRGWNITSSRTVPASSFVYIY